jgi:hypothetical protein
VFTLETLYQKEQRRPEQAEEESHVAEPGRRGTTDLKSEVKFVGVCV